MKAVVDQALALWGLQGASYTLAAARENHVYCVTSAGTKTALRLHREGYRTDAELRSELQWMAAVADGGLSVPAPVPSTAGTLLEIVDRVQIDMLHWLPGDTMVAALDGASAPRRAALFHTLGADMARLHAISDAWTRPADFDRPAWDCAGLVGDAPLWDRFWENPDLTPEDVALFQALRIRAHQVLNAQSLDYGLIHADLVGVNVLVAGEGLHMIDFDDGGFGYRLFDVVTALLKHMEAPYFDALRDSLIAGYRRVRPLDLTHFDLFVAVRAATYVGWNITRMAEPDAPSRNARFIATARHLARAYLG